MVVLLLIIVSFSSFAVAQDGLPITVRNGLQNAQTLEEFLSMLPRSNATLHTNADFHRGRHGISNKCDLTDSCLLVPACIPVGPDARDLASPYFPSCIKLSRCVDSSYDHRKRCVPTTSMVDVKVVHYKYVGNNNGYCSIRPLRMQNHTRCAHEGTSPFLERFQL